MVQATATIQIETPTVRVTRWDLPPGSHTGHHVHEFDYIVVPVTEGVLTITGTDGQVTKTPLSIGESYSRAAGVEHNVANLTTDAVAFVEVELLEHPHAT